MEPTFRRAFNAAFGPSTYAEILGRLERRLGCAIPFRVAETPLFLPARLRERLARSATEIVRQISSPALIAQMKRAIPAHLDAPGMDALPNCAQVDFAIVRGPDGELDAKVVELQAFPSLYALMLVQTEIVAEVLAGMPGLDRRWTCCFGGRSRDDVVAHLRRAILAGEPEESVVLLDLSPEKQKTYPDFVATKLLVGVDAVCPTALVREKDRLFRRVGGRLVPVRRLYNRVVFDELEAKRVELPFRYDEPLDVTWCSHPNWYWTWSKYTLPYLDHPAVPRARLLSALDEVPPDLERYVLKPLFSFAGSGVKVDVTPEHLAAIPEAERSRWLLQEKVAYEPALPMPDGGGVKAEVRMMFLRAPDEPELSLALDLVRLSRGKMLGVDQNRDLTWVGGTVGIWPVD
ncbi:MULTISPECIES: hypothetical protein [Sorangium]|uniref:Circularly permuted type 2 ATP-grasp protein n=1 Tax=Sorangium cellulosum TaxID=56 RepID=A0A4V0NGL4_SORCE|nr:MULTISPECIES: hypothetical protein [Sorangium]AUX33582.1 hypothetical protein SOCE836_057420 [Sorangium cellulosum]WCQ92894.1 hypothetical protein NQZ70_05640 [Sorangium sp. Soce836]